MYKLGGLELWDRNAGTILLITSRATLWKAIHRDSLYMNWWWENQIDNGPQSCS